MGIIAGAAVEVEVRVVVVAGSDGLMPSFVWEIAGFDDNNEDDELLAPTAVADKGCALLCCDVTSCLDLSDFRGACCICE